MWKEKENNSEGKAEGGGEKTDRQREGEGRQTKKKTTGKGKEKTIGRERRK